MAVEAATVATGRGRIRAARSGCRYRVVAASCSEARSDGAENHRQSCRHACDWGGDFADGKYAGAYSDPTGVYVRHIDSGETRPLALSKGFNGIPTSSFPDSMHLLMSNHEGAQHAAKIWKASILGGAPQMVLEDADQGTVSPDGSRIAFFRARDFVQELWIADAEGRESSSHGGAAGGNVSDAQGLVVGELVAGWTTDRVHPSRRRCQGSRWGQVFCVHAEFGRQRCKADIAR